MYRNFISRTSFVSCHRRPDRSFFIKGKQLPLCARCTGIVLGYLTMPLFYFAIISMGFWMALALNIPAFIDGTTQALGWRESNNYLRLTTGFLCGMGQIAIISLAGKALRYIISAIV